MRSHFGSGSGAGSALADATAASSSRYCKAIPAITWAIFVSLPSTNAILRVAHDVLSARLGQGNAALR